MNVWEEIQIDKIYFLYELNASGKLLVGVNPVSSGDEGLS